MDQDQLRRFASRDWRAIAQAKRAHQVLLFTRDGVGAAIRAARDLFAHARTLDPHWPSPRDRLADLAHHVELKRLLDAARSRFGKSGDGQPGR